MSVGRRYRGGEERPHVRSASGLRDLESARHAKGRGRLHVRMGVKHCLRAVEVGGKPPTGRIRKQRIQADEQIGVVAQVVGDNGSRQGQRSAIPQRPPAERVTCHRRPALGSFPQVLPVVGVDVSSRCEQPHVQRKLRFRRRGVRDQARIRRRKGRLLRWWLDSVTHPKQVPQSLILQAEGSESALEIAEPVRGGHLSGPVDLVDPRVEDRDRVIELHENIR